MTNKAPAAMAEPADFRGTVVRAGKYKFINPLILCDITQEKEAIPELDPVKNALQEEVDKETQSFKVESISVYLHLLNSARWTGVNENRKFSPASLLKVNIMIAYLKLAETSPELMNQKIVYDGSFNYDETVEIKNSHPLKPNASYTVAELLDNMILYSGNNARFLLKRNLYGKDQNFLNQVYEDLILPDPTGVGNDYMSPKQYANVFRALYNGTYLTKHDSEAALALLVNSEFRDGLIAGVPAGLTVAHKFGEREVVDEEGVAETNEFHDCGIVYYPDHPYFLCVMTKGKNFSDLQSVVRDISAVSYKEISRFFMDIKAQPTK